MRLWCLGVGASVDGTGAVSVLAYPDRGSHGRRVEARACGREKDCAKGKRVTKLRARADSERHSFALRSGAHPPRQRLWLTAKW